LKEEEVIAAAEEGKNLGLTVENVTAQVPKT
jgi:hypothetical protein